MLRVSAEIDEWDMPPAIALTTREDAPEAGLHPLMVPANLWTMAHPVVVVTALADLLGQDKMRIGVSEEYEQDRLTGMMFCFESWGVNTSGMTRQEADEIQEWGQTHSYADHPRGHEARSMAMIDRSGVVGFAEHTRGTEPPTQASVGTFSGRVVIAMEKFMAALEANPDALLPPSAWKS